MTLSKCAICGNKKSSFIKNQEAKGLLSNLGLRTPFNKVPRLGDILFWVYSGFKDNIWGADSADMQLISKFNKAFRFLLCVLIFLVNMLEFIFSQYPLKDKKGVSIANVFQKILDQSRRKLNKIWIEQRSEFCYSSVEKWLKDNNIEMYSIHKEGKSVVAEWFIRTLKTKYMTSILKNVYIDKLDDKVNEYNNTYHRTIKMKPADVKDNTYIDSMEMHSTELQSIKRVNDNDPKFKVGDHIRISKYKNIFATAYTPNWSEEDFVIKKVKNTVPWT